MKQKTLSLLILFLFIGMSGCASRETRIGSEQWHDMRVAEIQEAYNTGEIDKETYLKLKNETDMLRIDYEDRRYPYHHLGYRHYFGRSGIGLGLGF